MGGRVLFLAGGSISLSGVLRRYNLSAPINDLSLYSVGPWDAKTSQSFLDALSVRYGFPLTERNKQEMMGLLQEFVPYHLQLMFQAVLEVCRGDASNLSDQTIKSAFNNRLAGPSGGPFLDHYSERLDHIFSSEDAVIARLILSAASVSRWHRNERSGRFERSLFRDFAGSDRRRVRSFLFKPSACLLVANESLERCLNIDFTTPLL